MPRTTTSLAPLLSLAAASLDAGEVVLLLRQAQQRQACPRRDVAAAGRARPRHGQARRPARRRRGRAGRWSSRARCRWIESGAWGSPPSCPALSRACRLGRSARAYLSEMAATSPAMTTWRLFAGSLRRADRGHALGLADDGDQHAAAVQPLGHALGVLDGDGVDQSAAALRCSRCRGCRSGSASIGRRSWSRCRA